MFWLVAICITFATLTSLVFVPIVRRLATAVGMIDCPDQDRKLQASSVALGGGVAVYAALIVAFIGTIGIDRSYFGQILGDIALRWYILFACAGLLLLVGLVDDRWNLRGRQKLLLQCLILAALVGSGTVVQQISIFGMDLELGVFSLPVTVLWLLIAVNALNLIDGADGMAATAGSIICLGLGFASLSVGSPFPAMVGFALAGAQLGFLYFNRPPATIYLGDAGSMMIGLFVGVLAIWTNVKESAILSSAPIAILAIPLFDSTAAVLRRWLTGRSIYMTDRAHLHHLLQERYGQTKMLWFVAALCVTTTTLSVLSINLQLPWLSGVGLMLVASVLIYTRSFGHAEARLLAGRASRFARSFTVNPNRMMTERHHRSVPMQGVGEWELVWEPLVNFAKQHDLARVKIDLNLSWLQEGFHANWQSIKLPDRANQLSMRLPLFTRREETGTQIHIGLLEIVASADDDKVYDHLSQLSDKLEDLGPTIDIVVRGIEQTKQSSSPQRVSIDEIPASEASETVVDAPLEPITANGRSKPAATLP